MSDYADRQLAKAHAYRDAWVKWRSQNPEIGFKLRQLGIDRADDGITPAPIEVGDEEEDAINALRDLETCVEDVRIEDLGNIWQKQTQGMNKDAAVAWCADRIKRISITSDNKEKTRAIIAFLGWLRNTKNKEIALSGAEFAIGTVSLMHHVPTMTAEAQRIGCTRAAISKAAKSASKILMLPPSPHMKSIRACEAYSEARKRSHANQPTQNNHAEPSRDPNRPDSKTQRPGGG